MFKTKRKIALALLILVAFGTGTYLFFIHQPDPDANVAKQKGAENVAANTKENAATKKSSDSAYNAEKPVSNGALQEATLTITGFEQSNGSIKASAYVNSSGGGMCYFGFSSSNTKPVAANSQSNSGSSGQTCKIDIPEVEFTKLGEWDMVVIFTQNGKSVEAKRNVTIN